jgi:flagellar biosynthesis/type III secretory pathway M-ring protein FliF/YscJ
MDAMLSAILVDGVVNPWWVFAASSIFLAVVAGVATNYLVERFKRRWDKDDHAEEKEKTGVQTSIAQLGLRLAEETERRERAERDLHDKCESLGRDISQIREVFSNFLGRSNLPCPQWNKEK